MPLLVYGIICSFNLDPSLQKAIVAIASIASSALLIFSAWSMAANWEQQYFKSLQTQMDFSELYRLYKELGATTLVTLAEFRAEVTRLDSLAEKADHLAMELQMHDDEKRMGMRAGLREFQRKCASCGQIPTDLISTSCGICGNFKQRRI